MWNAWGQRAGQSASSTLGAVEILKLQCYTSTCVNIHKRNVCCKCNSVFFCARSGPRLACWLNNPLLCTVTIFSLQSVYVSICVSECGCLLTPSSSEREELCAASAEWGGVEDCVLWGLDAHPGPLRLQTAGLPQVWGPRGWVMQALSFVELYGSVSSRAFSDICSSTSSAAGTWSPIHFHFPPLRRTSRTIWCPLTPVSWVPSKPSRSTMPLASGGAGLEVICPHNSNSQLWAERSIHHRHVPVR